MVTKDDATEPPTDGRVSFRAIRPTDAEAIAALHAMPGFRFNTLRLPHPSPERVRTWIETMADTHTELVGCAGATLVATGGLTRFPGRRAHAGALGMGVHDDWTGRGIGTALLRELVSLAEDWHALRRLELSVYVDNARAIALYRRFGFVVEGTHHAYARRDGRWVDVYTMARVSAAGEDAPATTRTDS